MRFFLVSQKEDVDFAGFQQEERFFIICVEMEYHFLVTDFLSGWMCVQFVVQALNSTEAFSGLTGTDMQESIMNVSVMNTAMFVIQSKERDMD